MKTADPELTRGGNRFRIVDVIRRHEPIARVEIVERTELSPATVSAITGGLIEDGLVIAAHVGGEPSGRGRPRVMLRLNAPIMHAVGVKLSLRRISIAVTDFGGRAVHALVMPVRLDRQPAATVADLVEDGVRQCVSDAGLSLDAISGVGIGVPGVIDAAAGRSHWSPIFGHAVVDFASLIEQRLGRPVQIENDANLAALAESWFGRAQDLASFAVVTAEDTIGMGLLLGGRLHRGAHAIGAEFGHVKVEPDGALCRCGQRGCLDTVASGWALGREAAALQPATGSAAPMALADLTTLAEHDAGVRVLFERAGDMLGLALANLLNVLNLPRVILTGALLTAHDIVADRLDAALDRFMLPTLREATEIVRHDWGDEMWARGAASLVLRRLYGEP